jgi:hypothetical protein
MLSSSRSVVPIIGGIGFVFCAGLAAYLDVQDQVRKEKARGAREQEDPDRVFVRYISMITYDPNSRPAKAFLCGSVIFLICASITGVWQSETEGTSSLTTSAIAMSAAIFLMSVGAHLYKIHPGVGTFVHMVLAGLFQAFSLVYGFNSWKLASRQYGNSATITQARLGITCVASACLVLNFLLFRTATAKTMLLMAHVRNAAEEASRDSDSRRDMSDYQDTERTMLTAKERLNCRLWMGGLAALQYGFGTCIGALLFSGAWGI